MSNCISTKFDDIVLKKEIEVKIMKAYAGRSAEEIYTQDETGIITGTASFKVEFLFQNGYNYDNIISNDL